jgi:UDP:flavonoid glycosyltransferase YjiC (YdhE family)
MARIVVNTLGSTGDLFPFIALAQGLRERGHDVIFAVNAAQHEAVRKAGIEVVACGPELSEDDARQRLDMFDGSNPMAQVRKMIFEWLVPSITPSYKDLLKICEGADALIATTVQLAAHMVYEKTGIRWITASLSPMQFPSAYEAPMYWPKVLTNRLINPAAWRLVLAITRREFLPTINRIRAEHGFKPLRGAPTLEDFSPELVLLASSRHLSPPRPDWKPELKMTGFWFFDANISQWQPSAELEAFVSRGEKPILLSLGSMVQQNPREIVEMHVEAARRVGRRLIIQQGWALLDAGVVKDAVNRGEVIGAGFVPHDWLFPRVAAVIHHGGAGTTARALRYGRPMLLEPHGFDQPFNARLIERLGVGIAIDSHKRSVRRIESALRKILMPDVAQRAERIAIEVQKENGVEEACRLIEENLGVRAVQAAALSRE